jgi:hypothetical protein
LRLKFGLLCATRVAHFLEQREVLACLELLKELVNTQNLKEKLPALIRRSDELANRHPGSKSLDGVGHAAVSATYACAKAIAGQARQASEYAAYAAVYGQGGYGATSDPTAFDPEFIWQTQQLQALFISNSMREISKGGNMTVRISTYCMTVFSLVTLSSCATQYDSPATGPIAQLRVLQIQNQLALFSVYDKEPCEVGAKKSVFGAIGGHGGTEEGHRNGMPGRAAWDFQKLKERAIPAGKEFRLGVVSVIEKQNFYPFEKIYTCYLGTSFKPLEGKMYEAELVLTPGRCALPLYQISVDSGGNVTREAESTAKNLETVCK